MSTLGLYIHIPFCLRKCHYCDFVSYPNMLSSFDEYIEALLTEAKLYSPCLTSRDIDTVFIGGGTPSLLSPSQIERLVSGLQSITNFCANEFTIESNPETITEQKIVAYANAGINRISIGLQSHDNGILRVIGRQHTYQDFLNAYNTAQKHINNVNIDTIFGLPGQSMQSFRSTIQALIELLPTHISSYALKLEQGTKLFETFSGMDDDTDREMYHTAIDMLTEAGYKLYETSNFAKDNYECKHNMKYWTGKEYLGLGVAAHSYLDGNTRYSNTDDIKQYFTKLHNSEKPTDHIVNLTDSDIKEEYIMLRLRLSQGINFKDYFRQFGTSFKQDYDSAVSWSENLELVIRDEVSMRPTIKGFDLQNTLITQFMKKM